MDAIYRQDGNTIDYKPANDISAGTVVVIGNLVGVANVPIKANSLGSISVQGAYEINKANGAIVAGDFIYWNDTDKNVTTSASGTSFFGIALRDAASAEGTATVLLQQFRPQSVETVPVALAAPDITATATANTTADIAFTAVAHATSYKIRRATTEAGLLSQKGTSATYENGKIAVTGLTANTAYYWQVKAIGNGTNYTDSDWSAAATATTSNA